MASKRLEASVVQSIATQLTNLGWIVDERNPLCNVTQQRAKTEEQTKRLGRNRPDFVLYEAGTNRPIAIIEAKSPGHSLRSVLDEAEDKYARPLEAPLIFAYNDTFVQTRYLFNGRHLRIDGEEIRQFVNQYTAMQFVEQGPEILSVPENVKVSREQLIGIFRNASNLLREAGLQAGLERFGAFSDILFLKIMDEVSSLRIPGEQPPIPAHLKWSQFAEKKPSELHTYMNTVVWPQMNKLHNGIFGESLPIQSPEILHEIIQELSWPGLNLTAADTDVKGDAFEYFLQNAYQGLNIKDLGEYFTPRNIVKFMVSIVNPQMTEKIYDPFCGTGGFLIEAFRYLRLRTRNLNEFDHVLKTNTVFGSEITSNARIAKMNMILIGDGHSNIVREDSLANPKRGKYDIVLTNPPYSTETRHSGLYGLSKLNADPICFAHCFDALKESGRAAILVKEDFLTKDGEFRTVREKIMREAKNFSIISLPRKLFEPYTPTKTSIVYFEKAGKRNRTFFFVVNNIGYSLGPRKTVIPENDLPFVLEAFNEERASSEIDSAIIENDIIANNDYSMWIYDYIGKDPNLPYKLEPLGKFISKSGEVVDPRDNPDEEFVILGVNKQQGIYENEVKLGSEINQRYIKVETGDIEYNPHRVNLGSIGIVTEAYNGGHVSPIYIVFRSIDPKIPNTLIWSLLKSDMFKNIIRAYDTRHGAVRPNLSWDQLTRIKVPILPKKEMNDFIEKQANWESLTVAVENIKRNMFEFVGSLEVNDE